MFCTAIFVIGCGCLIGVTGNAASAYNENAAAAYSFSVVPSPLVTEAAEPEPTPLLTGTPTPSPSPSSWSPLTEDFVVETATPPLTPTIPPLFESILSTLEERLSTTMELPLLQDERERIMQSTLEGLKRCKKQYRSSNIQLRYRSCVSREVQGALKKAQAIEFQLFNPPTVSSPSIEGKGRMLPIPGEVQNREIYEVSKKMPDAGLF